MTFDFQNGRSDQIPLKINNGSITKAHQVVPSGYTHMQSIGNRDLILTFSISNIDDCG